MQGNAYVPSAFRLAERKYKFYKKPLQPCDYSEVVEWSDVSHTSPGNAQRIFLHDTVTHEGRTLRIYGLQDKPGFYFIPGALSCQEQAQWTRTCLAEYAQPPNYSNLGVLDSNVWQDHLRGASSALSKLRWVTLGYHYNWSTNIYEDTADRITCFPSEIGSLCARHAEWCGFAGFEAQAGIVNYYKANSSMMKAHQDESEFTFDQPIFSYCLGSSCIFLLGHVSTDVAPTAMFMRSGDLMVMGGHSRVYYHGVARILPDSCPPELMQELCKSESKEMHAMAEYLRDVRINLNIRQVFPQDAPRVFLSDAERKQLLQKAMQRAQ